MSNETNELDVLYAKLYNSLGVEPGLLSKTSIGRSINDKFRDNDGDTKMYSEKYIQNKIVTNDEESDNDKITMITLSPLNGRSELMAIDHGHDNIIKYTLDGILKFYMNKNNISEIELLDELKSFIEERFKYTLVKKIY